MKHKRGTMLQSSVEIFDSPSLWVNHIQNTSTVNTQAPNQSYPIRAAVTGTVAAVTLVTSAFLLTYAVWYFRQAREGQLPQHMPGDGLGVLLFLLFVLIISVNCMAAAWGLSIYAWKQHHPWVWMWRLSLFTTVLLVVYGAWSFCEIVYAN